MPGTHKVTNVSDPAARGLSQALQDKGRTSPGQNLPGVLSHILNTEA